MAKMFSHIGRLPLRPFLVTLFLGGMLSGAANSVLAASSASLSVSAVLLSKNQCKFNTKTALINFGNLDPASPVDVTATATLDFVCLGSAPLATFSLSDDDGLYETGPNANRMLHSTLPGQYLAYGLDLNPVSGTAPKNVPQILTLTGKIKGSDYQTALAGAYTDTVTITIVP